MYQRNATEEQTMAVALVARVLFQENTDDKGIRFLFACLLACFLFRLFVFSHASAREKHTTQTCAILADFYFW